MPVQELPILPHLTSLKKKWCQRWWPSSPSPSPTFIFSTNHNLAWHHPHMIRCTHYPKQVNFEETSIFFRHISSFVRCSIRVVYYIPKKLFSAKFPIHIKKTCHKRKSGPFVWFSLQLTEQNQAILLHQLTCTHTRTQPQRRNNLILRQLDCNAS